MTNKEHILKLKEGESWTWPESDYGKAEIWKINELYFLFSIPSFGGLPSFYGAFQLNKVNELIIVVQGWS